MITCVIRYHINPRALAAFETYARQWIALVNRLGGQHHGYFLPGEGASDVALALFSFPSLAAYAAYRATAACDPDCLAAVRFAEEQQCFTRYDRTFFRPLVD